MNGWLPRWGRTRVSQDADQESTARPPSPRVRVLSRVGCHLCDDLLVLVDDVCGRLGETYETLDVDADPALLARYGDLVPVVFVDGAEFATWRIDAADLGAALARPHGPTE